MTLKDEITRVVPEEMTLGFALVDSKTGETILIHEHETFPLASLSKFIAAVIAVERGVNVRNELIHSAIAEHSIQAYKAILHELPEEEMNTELETRELRIHVHADNKNKLENCGTPAAVMKFLEITRNRNLPVVMNALKDQSDPDGFRFQRFSEGEWLHMTGGMDGICNDIGYWKLPDRIITCAGLLRSYSSAVGWPKLEEVMNQLGGVIANAYRYLESSD